jgi:uncharacterized Zn finger protein (UPF0148 family)
MSQAPKTGTPRDLWETCPKCYGDLLADRDGGLYCPQGHYRAANATTLPPDADGGSGQMLVADGGGCPECGSPAYRREGSCSVCLACGFSPCHGGVRE